MLSKIIQMIRKNGFDVLAWIVTLVVFLCWACAARAQHITPLPTTHYWTGYVSTDWFEPANWDPTSVPTEADSVIIPAGCVRYPILQAGTMAESNYFEMQPGSTLIFTHGLLTISGDAVINGNLIAGKGMIRFCGKSLQQVSIDPAIKLYDLVIANTSPDGVIFLHNINAFHQLYLSENATGHFTTDTYQPSAIQQVAELPAE